MWTVRVGLLLALVCSLVSVVTWGAAAVAGAQVGFPVEWILVRGDGYASPMQRADAVLRTLDVCLLMIPASLGIYYSVDSLRESFGRHATDRHASRTSRSVNK